MPDEGIQWENKREDGEREIKMYMNLKKSVCRKLLPVWKAHNEVVGYAMDKWAHQTLQQS